MSTRSIIAIQDEGKESGEWIYCHHDGYLDGVGAILSSSYDVEMTKELMERGDIVTLADNVADTKFFRDRSGEKIDLISKVKFENLDALEEVFHNSVWFEYLYILINNVWFVYTKESRRYLMVGGLIVANM